MSPKNPRAAEVAAKYKEKYGVESGTYGIALYEMTMFYFDAVAKVGDPTDTMAVAEAIAQTDKQIATGRLKFDQATHLATQGIDYVPIQFYQIVDGERVLFYPPAYATGEFVMPPWMKK